MGNQVDRLADGKGVMRFGSGHQGLGCGLEKEDKMTCIFLYREKDTEFTGI
jgi:hypothetical protein